MKKCGTIKVFQERLVSITQQCADGADIHILWHDFLFSILKNWNADIQMDLHDAVVVMSSATGLHKSITYKEFFYMILGVKPKIDFWFKLPPELQRFSQEVQYKKRIFKMTIAVFETINYWCWYNSPIVVSFNREALIDVLENGSINIDWTSYQQP